MVRGVVVRDIIRVAMVIGVVGRDIILVAMILGVAMIFKVILINFRGGVVLL